ncbi:hypothetical protein C0992_011279 [Termitomyces sp. T32_za158]|nr:hypothetical protein C0992_011279 [Termitomyces sp. T32_za158]
MALSRQVKIAIQERVEILHVVILPLASSKITLCVTRRAARAALLNVTSRQPRKSVVLLAIRIVILRKPVPEIPLLVQQISLLPTVRTNAQSSIILDLALYKARAVEMVTSNVQVDSVLQSLFNAKRLERQWDSKRRAPATTTIVAKFPAKIPARQTSYGGTCSAGMCQKGNFLDTAKAWYTQNLQIAIPVTVVAGIVVLFLIWAIARSIARCCGYRKSLPSSEPAFARAHHQRIESWDRNAEYSTAPSTLLPPGTSRFSQANASYVRVPPEQRGRDNWVDESAYNGR